MSNELALPEDDDRTPIALNVRTRHADLWALVRRFGSARAAAAEVGVNLNTFHQWVKLRAFPRYPHDQARLNEVETSLLTLTGKTLDQLWPTDMRRAIDAELLARDVDVTSGVEMRRVLARAERRMIAPAPDREAEKADARAFVLKLVNDLSGRCRHVSATVVKMWFGLEDGRGYTLEEIGKAMRVTRERVRQIIFRSVRMLQQKADSDPGLKRELESALALLGED